MNQKEILAGISAPELKRLVRRAAWSLPFFLMAAASVVAIVVMNSTTEPILWPGLTSTIFYGGLFFWIKPSASQYGEGTLTAVYSHVIRKGLGWSLKIFAVAMVWVVIAIGFSKFGIIGDKIGETYDAVMENVAEIKGGAVDKVIPNSTRSIPPAPTNPTRAIAGANGSATKIYAVFREGHERGIDDVPEAEKDTFMNSILNGDRNFGDRDTVWTYQSSAIEIPFRVSTQNAGADLGAINHAMVSLTEVEQIMAYESRKTIDYWAYKVGRKKEADEFNIVRYFWTETAANDWRNRLPLQTFYPTLPPTIQ